MGWTETALGARDHIDETVGAANIVRRAWGTGGYGEKHCWLHVKSDRYEGIVLVLVKYGKWGGKTSTCIKLVDETMGPGVYDVPDKIWDNRPDLPADAAYATEWRENVEKFRARWPRTAKDLGDADVGKTFAVHEHVNTYTFTGWHYHHSSLIPTFGGCRISNWKTARVAEIAAAA